MSGSFSLIFQFGIFLIGAYLAIRGDITSGTVVVFVNLSGYLVNSIGSIPRYWANRKAAAALVEKLAQVTEEHAGRAGDPVPPELNEAITLENVTFGYEPEKPVLQNMSMRLESGKKYALVGASGSGKSTLLNLLMGAYDGYEGSIAVDGKELREIDTDSLYDVMSLIGQNVFLFDDTLYQNITMFRNFPEDQLELAVHRSGLDGLTRVVVTHRLEAALLEQYDGIFVLRGGKVCEMGRFQDLMDRKEYFYSLYTVANG